MTSSWSRRAGVVQGSEPTATDPEPSSGVGPAFHLDEPEPTLRSYLELGALPTADGAKDDIRRVVVGLLDELGPDNPLAREARRRLAAALY